MLRFRRYRVFWILAVFVIGALYHFKIFSDSTTRESNDVGGLRGFGLQHEHDDLPAADTAPEEIVSGPPELGPQEKEKEVEEEEEEDIQESKGSGLLHDSTSDHLEPPRPVAESTSISQPEKEVDPNDENKSELVTDGKLNALPTESSSPVVVDTPEEPGEGRSEVPKDSLTPKIHWSKLPEHFPIPSASIIQLPTGKPKQIPNIQHVFADESANDKISREQKLDKIKKTFEFSWAGYKERAWMDDELSPVSGKSRNPFCGWAATLVDSLDTLWIMDMKEEFEEAANAVKDIDFTTTDRKDIPLFETAIRYLGGLLSAYDLSGGTYRVLLDKAVELAEVLMGAFDTPNRMPIAYYFWKPTFASQPHRARARTVLAELGSLSVEFTRLAQLTREPKYYDAVARITNEFAAWQNKTKLPGLWPLKVDASGCKKPDVSSTMSLQSSSPDASRDVISSPITDKAEIGHIDDSDGQTAKDASLEKSSANDAEGVNPLDATASKSLPTVDDLSRSNVGNIKRQLAEEDTSKGTKTANADANDLPACEPQGLASPPGSSSEEFSLGGQADSIYEYLPKEYMLLGGLEDVYRRMYEMAVETAKKYLLFRPMLPKERNVLLLGILRTSGHLDNLNDLSLQSEGTHLTCFAGGMFAIGAKIFNREGDMDIARKLTDGCVWAYEATLTGIMPERYLAVPCQNQERCDWNETLYHQMAYPSPGPAEGHLKASQQAILDSKNLESNQNPATESDRSQEAEEPTQSGNDPDAKEAKPSATGASETKDTRVSKRQLADFRDEKTIEPGSTSARPTVHENIPAVINIDEEESGKTRKVEENIPDVEQSTTENDASEDRADEIYNQPPTPTLQESAKTRISDDRLPIGMTNITSSSYILRPEAIESVFIMYRVTGDSYWREKGWTMFEAIKKHTTSTYGASGIKDVTSDTPVHTDVMESFWLAETLKYFYLLFSDPDLISLDDYVLNTEAHPFKRPK